MPAPAAKAATALRERISKLKKPLMEGFEKFKKTPWTIPVAIGITAGMFYLLLVFVLGTCLITLLPPFVLLGVLWFFNVKTTKKLLVAGLIGVALMMAVEVVFFVNMYQTIEPVRAYSDDLVLTNGTVDPMRGDASTVFNYTLQINKLDNTSTIGNVTVRIYGLSGDRNETMSLFSRTNTTAIYYYRTTISDPINLYLFWANISGKSYSASDHVGTANTLVMGPIYADAFAIAKPLLNYGLVLFLQFYLMFGLMVGMIWWTRRSRKYREEQLQRWEKSRKEKEAAGPPKEETKVPSLARAMGKTTEDTFVCSECGADVPADATECPKCGEKFE
jgi:ribosomal protein L40E